MGYITDDNQESRFTFRLTKTEGEMLRAVADERKVKVSALIRLILKRELKRWQWSQ